MIRLFALGGVEHRKNDPFTELADQARADSGAENRAIWLDNIRSAIKLILPAVGLVGMVFVCFAIALAVLRLGVGP